jgi:hypothetical protein
VLIKKCIRNLAILRRSQSHVKTTLIYSLKMASGRPKNVAVIQGVSKRALQL